MPKERNAPGTPVPALDPAFVALLACPACETRPRLRLEEGAVRLRCDRCGRVYPIIDGIPDLVVSADEAPAAAPAEPQQKP